MNKNYRYITINCCDQSNPEEHANHKQAPTWLRTYLFDEETKDIFVPSNNFTQLAYWYALKGIFQDENTGIWYMKADDLATMIRDESQRESFEKSIVWIREQSEKGLFQAQEPVANEN